MKRRLPLYQVRRLEREGVLTFLRPVVPRPPERSRKAHVSVPRRERRAPRGYALGRKNRLSRAEKWDRANDEWAIIADGISPPIRPAKESSRCRRGPCAYVSCKFHLYLDVDPETGLIKINHPGKDPTELKHPCALRLQRKVQRTGQQTSTKLVAKAMNLTSERIRQTEATAIKKLRVLLDDDPALAALNTGAEFGRGHGGPKVGSG